MGSIRGKSLKAIADDIAEGYIAVNPLFLKPFDEETLKALMEGIKKLQNDVRAEKFPHMDTHGIRRRNTKLQRLHSASMVIRNFARERRVILL
jgi:hypothetical protein